VPSTSAKFKPSVVWENPYRFHGPEMGDINLVHWYEVLVVLQIHVELYDLAEI
jgi:hypothetical protein